MYNHKHLSASNPTSPNLEPLQESAILHRQVGVPGITRTLNKSGRALPQQTYSE